MRTPEWETVPLNGRKVYIAFDSDLMEKSQVRGALARLSFFLKSKGAEVLFIFLPSSEGSKVGLDDFFAAGGTIVQLLKHANDDTAASIQATNSRRSTFNIRVVLIGANPPRTAMFRPS